MIGARADAAMALVLLAALSGTIGTGLIFTALTDHLWGAAVWGLAQGQRSLRQRRLSRVRGG
jgi:hypothetical protein